MAQEARISSRIDADLKRKGDLILSQIGIKPSQAITMFYTQIVRHGGIPFELKIPNEETVAAMNEDISKAKRYKSLEAMFTDLDTEYEQ